MAFFSLNWYRTERQMYILTTSKTYILIGHVPVRPLTVGHHLPHDNAIAPDITGGGELAVLDGFRGSPADGDFAALRSRQKATRMQWDKDYLWKHHHWNNQMLVAQHNPEHGVTVPLILPRKHCWLKFILCPRFSPRFTDKYKWKERIMPPCCYKSHDFILSQLCFAAFESGI